MSTTFEDAKVGDRVWSCFSGWGKIISINDSPNFPIFAEFKSRQDVFTFGGAWLRDGLQVLFWDEVKIIAPEKPKSKVKKWRWVIGEGENIFVSRRYYESAESFASDTDTTCSIVLQKIDSTEIEE